MHNIKTPLLRLFIFCLSLNAFSQNALREKDYTINYGDKNIELVFDTPVSIKAFDVNNKQELNVTSESNNTNSFVVNNLVPSEIIKVEYSYLNGKNNDHLTTYIANQSTSTGTINVYFNHPVDTSVAQTQNAVNLGSTLDDMLISYINACVATLDIAVYSSSSPSGTTGIAGAINAAYNRGVQVRVIYDGSTTSGMIPLLNPAIPTLSSPTGVNYGIMHNKFVIFDANNSNANLPVVWTGSTNWTVAQIDGPDKNSAIVIQDQALALGYKIEFEEMWGSNTLVPDTAVSKFGPFKTDNTPHTYSIGGKQVNSYFSPSDGTNAKIIAAINTANSDIDIATMLITRSDISNALIAKYNGGLTNLYTVVDSQNPSGNQFTTLQGAINTTQIVKYTGSGIMHHKFMVVDNFNAASDPQVVVGSHNWSTSAETKNDENILIVHDANITNQYYQAFVYLFGQAGGVLQTNENAIPQETLVAYPNPTKGIVYLSSTEDNLIDSSTIRVYNVLGETVIEQKATNTTQERIDLTNQASGMYFVEVLSHGKALHYKIVKN